MLLLGTPTFTWRVPRVQAACSATPPTVRGAFSSAPFSGRDPDLTTVSRLKFRRGERKGIDWRGDSRRDSREAKRVRTRREHQHKQTAMNCARESRYWRSYRDSKVRPTIRGRAKPRGRSHGLQRSPWHYLLGDLFGYFATFRFSHFWHQLDSFPARVRVGGNVLERYKLRLTSSPPSDRGWGERNG